MFSKVSWNPRQPRSIFFKAASLPFVNVMSTHISTLLIVSIIFLFSQIIESQIMLHILTHILKKLTTVDKNGAPGPRRTPSLTCCRLSIFGDSIRSAVWARITFNRSIVKFTSTNHKSAKLKNLRLLAHGRSKVLVPNSCLTNHRPGFYHFVPTENQMKQLTTFL